jgi:hypothetical protein
MRNFKRSVMLISLLVLMLCLALAPATVRAQSENGTPEQAIALAAAHPAFATLLSMHEGYNAAAYFTDNPQAIWRVTFWTADWQDLGFADVSLRRGRVYSFQAINLISDAMTKQAEALVLKFAQANREVRDILQQPDEYQYWIMYHVELNAWSVFFYRWGGDTVQALVQFQGDPLRFQNPKLVGIYFPNVLPYGDWYEAAKSQAVTIAFTSPEIAQAARAHPGWVADAAPDGDMWNVAFKSGETVFAEARIDLRARQIVHFKVG